VKSRLVLPFWHRLTRVVPEKGPLNGCVCGIAFMQMQRGQCVCLSVVTHNRELYKTARKGIWIGSADVVWVVVDSGGPKNPGPRSSLPRAGCTAGHLPVIIVKYMEYPAPEEVIGSLENLTTTLYNTLLRDSGMPASQNAECNNSHYKFPRTTTTTTI